MLIFILLFTFILSLVGCGCGYGNPPTISFTRAIAFTQKRFAMAVNTMRYSAIVCDNTQHAIPCNYTSHQTSAIAFTQKRFAMARNAIPSILSAILFSPTAAAAAYLGAVIVELNLGKKRNQEQKTSQILFCEFLQDNQGHRDRIYQSVWESSVRTMTKGVI